MEWGQGEGEQQRSALFVDGAKLREYTSINRTAFAGEIPVYFAKRGDGKTVVVSGDDELELPATPVLTELAENGSAFLAMFRDEESDIRSVMSDQGRYRGFDDVASLKIGPGGHLRSWHAKRGDKWTLWVNGEDTGVEIGDGWDLSGGIVMSADGRHWAAVGKSVEDKRPLVFGGKVVARLSGMTKHAVTLSADGTRWAASVNVDGAGCVYLDGELFASGKPFDFGGLGSIGDGVRPRMAFREDGARFAAVVAMGKASAALFYDGAVGPAVSKIFAVEFVGETPVYVARGFSEKPRTPGKGLLGVGRGLYELPGTFEFVRGPLCIDGDQVRVVYKDRDVFRGYSRYWRLELDPQMAPEVSVPEAAVLPDAAVAAEQQVEKRNKIAQEGLDRALADLMDGEEAPAAAVLAVENARRAEARGDVKSYEEQVNKALAAQSDHPQALVMRAKIKGSRKDLQGAFDDLQKAIDKDSKCAVAFGIRAQLQAAVRKKEEALADADRALEPATGTAGGGHGQGATAR